MKKIYAVGVLQLDTSPNARRIIKSERLWHLFAHFEEAERCVLENAGDLFEYYYNYALIEEIRVIDSQDVPDPGEFTGFPREWWYFADYSKMDENKNPTISPIEKPQSLESVAYFWVG